MAEERKEAEYHSKDFEWDDLREEVENDPSLLYRLAPYFPAHLSSSTSSVASDSWRSFHRRHSTGRFFKERRYLLKEFPELVAPGGPCRVLELGCGNGSTVLPILRSTQCTIVYACDCSTEALERAKELIEASVVVSIRERFHPFLLDFSSSGFPNWLFCNSCRMSALPTPGCSSDVAEYKITGTNDLPSLKGDPCCIGGVDCITLIFTLSAVAFQKMPSVIAKCISVLKPGCLLLFRDYGLYDMTMLRFPPEQRTGFREYMRSDGTFSYFFSLDTARNLFLGAGFIELELEYCCVRSVNHKSGKNMRRVWVHGKFQKPM